MHICNILLEHEYSQDYKIVESKHYRGGITQWNEVNKRVTTVSPETESLGTFSS